MQIIETKWTGDFEATGLVTVRGMIAGDVIVRAGATMHINGMVCGHLDAEPGSTVTISGMVNGIVRNHGADVSITGMVDDVQDLGDRETRMGPKAVNRRLQGRR